MFYTGKLVRYQPAYLLAFIQKTNILLSIVNMVALYTTIYDHIRPYLLTTIVIHVLITTIIIVAAINVTKTTEVQVKIRVVSVSIIKSESEHKNIEFG